ncbi:MaoC family dehydratase [Zhongshania guokunii]|uniref:MaoC family dehydratase n=1 Tax=Zhongshania guokunii TaxID=641783 RepID=A0ABV3UAI5_9GAMM
MVAFVDKEKIAEKIGFEPEPTSWFTVDQETINKFADCTLDRQFIHVDPDKAKATPFGTTIAHGFLSLSMLSHFAEQYSVLINGYYMGVNYGFDKVRFISPVKVNSRIRAVPKILDISTSKPGQYLFKTQVTIEIENEDKPACVAEWLTVQMIA